MSRLVGQIFGASGSGWVLVTYSTAAGSTAAIAERIAEVLRVAGRAVQCLPASADLDLEGVDALVVGSAVHDMAWLASSVQVLRRRPAAGSAEPSSPTGRAPVSHPRP